MTNENNLPSQDSIARLLDRLAPGSTGGVAKRLSASFTNFTHLIEFALPDGRPGRLVLHRYNPAAYGAPPKEKARVEYQTLAWLHGLGLPVAEPLLLDLEGALLGSTGFVMRFVAGQPVMYPDHPPADPLAWAAEMGKMLAAIHSVPCRPIPPFLQDDNALALYFLRSGAIPDYLKADPDGIRIWRAILDHLPDFTRTKTALIHLDFWAGNLLWEAGRISAVVDWEEAGYGDPGIDVAYCQMDLILAGQPEAARAFLQAYEDAMGCPTANLNFWKLAAAVRPILQPQGWIDASPFQERFRQFVTEALQALASTPPNAASEPEPATIAEILEDQALWSEAEKRVQTAENQTPISSKQVMRAFGISESDLDDIDVDIE